MFTYARTMLALDRQGLTFAGTVLLAKGQKATPCPPPCGFLPPPSAPITIDGEAEAERIAGLLALAYGRPLADWVLARLQKAVAHWNRGEGALANIMLAHLGLPEVDADALAKVSAAARRFDVGFLTESEIDAILKRFNPDEPRDARGRWTSGGSALQPQPKPGTQSATYSTDDEDDDENDEEDDDDTETDEGSAPTSDPSFRPSSSPADSQSLLPGVTPVNYERAPGNIGNLEDQYSPTLDGFHYYETENIVCPVSLQCTADEMKYYLSSYAVPGQNPGDPVSVTDTPDVYIPGTKISIGTVTIYVSPDGLTIANLTNLDHLLYDGIVVRTAELLPNGWSVKTIGIGNNVIPGADVINGFLGPDIFNQIDKAMKTRIANDKG